jgi:hypothetical protein
VGVVFAAALVTVLVCPLTVAVVVLETEIAAAGSVCAGLLLTLLLFTMSL